MTAIRDDLAQAIIEAGQFLYSRGWSPATSSNYSARLTSAEVLVTASGKHKGQLTADDLLAVDMNGLSLELGKNPSAETLLQACSGKSIRATWPTLLQPRGSYPGRRHTV